MRLEAILVATSQDDGQKDEDAGPDQGGDVSDVHSRVRDAPTPHGDGTVRLHSGLHGDVRDHGTHVRVHPLPRPHHP